MPAIRTATTGAFRFQGTRSLLTYSHVGNFDTAYALAEGLVAHIAPLGNDNFQWKWAVEQHHNEGVEEGDLEGDWHVHFAFDLGKACTERGQVFDFEGHHPNIRPCGGKKQWKNTLVYLEKDNCFQTNIPDNIDKVDKEIEGVDKNDVFRRALEAESEEQFFQTIAEGAPQDFCKSYLSIRACGQDRFQKKRKQWMATRTLSDFTNVPQVMADYAAYINSEEHINRPKSLIIISPTRYGKTEWARTIHANHAIMATEWNQDTIREDATVLIFDDVPMSEILPRQRWKAFFGMQQEFDISGKYRSPRHILRGWKGFIFTCNDDPRYEEGVSQSIANYITANSYIVTIDTPLFN